MPRNVIGLLAPILLVISLGDGTHLTYLEEGEPMDRLLDKKQLADYLGISVSGINSLLAHGEIPSPLRIGYKIVRWRESDIVSYLESLRTASNEHDETRKSKQRSNLLQKTAVLKELLVGGSLLYGGYELVNAFFSLAPWV